MASDLDNRVGEGGMVDMTGMTDNPIGEVCTCKVMGKFYNP